MSRPETGRRAAWTEEPAEPEGRLKSAPQAEWEHRTSDEGRRRNRGAPAEGGRHVSRPGA